ncbi:MAG: tetratricopeptide repeat protein, partial [Deltaproteobacteria bacterium]|nr:tetratricopeptide repeat protein [Deltaproteobacteria bacterium]
MEAASSRMEGTTMGCFSTFELRQNMQEPSMNVAFRWISGVAMLLLLAVAVACGPATTQQTTGDPLDDQPTLTQEELKAKQVRDEEEARRAALAKALEMRKVKVAEKPEFVPGVEVQAQKSFRDGVISVYQAPPDYGAAAQSFEQASSEDKNFLEAYFNLGMVYERTGRNEEALSVYQKALDANPESGSAKGYVGKVYLAKARDAFLAGDDAKGVELEGKAKSLFDEVIARDPDNVEVNNALALYWLMKARGEKDRARQLDALTTCEDFVRNVLILQPANVVALNTRGLIYLLKGELQIARWIFENKVLTLDKYSTEAYNNLGLTYFQLGDTPKAVVNFQRAIGVNQENLEARLNLAAVYLNYLNYHAALEQYEYVLTERPDMVEAVVGLGSCKVGMAEFDDGFALYRKAFELDTARVDLLLRIARIYQVKLVDFDKAAAAYQEFIDSGTKLGVDVSEGVKGLDQAHKMAEQMKKMEEEMAMAEAEAKKMEEEMKAKAQAFEKRMKKVESQASDYRKQLDAFMAENGPKAAKDAALKKKINAAKKLATDLVQYDTAFKEAREYIGMGMVADSEPMIQAVEDKFKAHEAAAIDILEIKKVQKVEEEGATPPTEEKKEEPAPKAEEKKEEPAPKAEEKKEEPAPKAEEKKEEPAPKAEEKKEEPAPKAEEKKE